MKIEIDQPGFMIFGPIPTPKPVPPPPPPRKEPSDELLSQNSECEYRLGKGLIGLVRCRFVDGVPTGELMACRLQEHNRYRRNAPWHVFSERADAVEWLRQIR
jgi:hypothetical protein